MTKQETKEVTIEAYNALIKRYSEMNNKIVDVNLVHAYHSLMAEIEKEA